MQSIGIRELRQWASRYVDLVRQGSTVQITDRGHPVALLVPVPAVGEIARLTAEGRLSPERGDLLALGPPLAPAPGKALPSKQLAHQRSDER